MSNVPVTWITSSRRRLLAVSALVLTLGTAPTFLRTFVNDDATYVPVAQKLNAGGLLYRDAVDNKPPLLYATFAATFRLLGTSSVAVIKLLTIAVQLGCAGLLFLIGRRLFERRVGALAALFFSLAVVTGVAEDFAAPNTEAYMNLFVLGAVLVLSRNLERPTRAQLLATGALLAVATLYRLQGAAAFLGAILFFMRRRRDRVAVPMAAAWMGLGFAVPLLSAIGYLAARGTLTDFWIWAVRDNFPYVRLGAAHFGWRALRRIALVVLCQLPLLVAVIHAGAAWPRLGEAERIRSDLLWMQLFAALVAYQMGSRFYGHYFLQVLPFLALLAAWAYANLPHERWPWLRLTPHLLAVWLLGFTVSNGVRLSATSEGDGFRDAVAFVKSHSGPYDQLFLWSASSQLTFDSGRIFATRFPFNNYLTGSIFGTDHALPSATRETNRALESADGWRMLRRDLGASPPAIIIDGGRKGFELWRYPFLHDFVQRLYSPAVRFGTLEVFRRLPLPVVP